MWQVASGRSGGGAQHVVVLSTGRHRLHLRFFLGGLIRVIAAWCTPGCGKWQCDELPKQQPHLGAAVDDDDDEEDEDEDVATAADGVDCAPVKCKLHISQKTKKSKK